MREITDDIEAPNMKTWGLDTEVFLGSNGFLRASTTLHPTNISPNLGGGLGTIGCSHNHLIHTDLQVTNGKDAGMGGTQHVIGDQVTALIVQLNAFEIVTMVARPHGNQSGL